MFIACVLQAVSPEGRTANLGELIAKENGEARQMTSIPLKMFSLIITAESCFAVRMPSELVALENEVLEKTKGKNFLVNDCKLMKKGRTSKRRIRSP